MHIRLAVDEQWTIERTSQRHSGEIGRQPLRLARRAGLGLAGPRLEACQACLGAIMEPPLALSHGTHKWNLQVSE